MSTEMIGRILTRAKELGLKPRGLSLKAGLGPTTVRDIVQKPGASPRHETIRKLAEALETTPEWLAYGIREGEEAPSDVALQPSLAKLTGRDTRRESDFVLARHGGIAEATAFRPADDVVDPDRGPELVPRDDRYPRGDYTVYEVVGDSMNAADPPIQAGSRVVTIKTDNPYSPIALQTGDIVVVRRTKEQGGLIELSVKELELGEAETRYLPRSKSGRHQPIVVRKDLHAEDETVVEVVGLVIDVMTKVRRR